MFTKDIHHALNGTSTLTLLERELRDIDTDLTNDRAVIRTWNQLLIDHGHERSRAVQDVRNQLVGLQASMERRERMKEAKKAEIAEEKRVKKAEEEQKKKEKKHEN